MREDGVYDIIISHNTKPTIKTREAQFLFIVVSMITETLLDVLH